MPSSRFMNPAMHEDRLCSRSTARMFAFESQAHRRSCFFHSQSKFLERPQPDLGRPPRNRKIFCFAFSANQLLSRAVPHPSEGRTRRHGRWVRDTMDAAARKTKRACSRTAKPCGPDIPTLMSNRSMGRRITSDDASHRAEVMSLRITPVMVARKPGHQGEPGGSRKTIVRGKPDRSDFTCGD
jgi:hypothetical protein